MNQFVNMVMDGYISAMAGGESELLIMCEECRKQRDR